MCESRRQSSQLNTSDRAYQRYENVPGDTHGCYNFGGRRHWQHFMMPHKFGGYRDSNTGLEMSVELVQRWNCWSHGSCGPHSVPEIHSTSNSNVVLFGCKDIKSSPIVNLLATLSFSPPSSPCASLYMPSIPPSKFSCQTFQPLSSSRCGYSLPHLH